MRWRITGRARWRYLPGWLNIASPALAVIRGVKVVIGAIRDRGWDGRWAGLGEGDTYGSLGCRKVVDGEVFGPRPSIGRRREVEPLHVEGVTKPQSQEGQLDAAAGHKCSLPQCLLMALRAARHSI